MGSEFEVLSGLSGINANRARSLRDARFEGATFSSLYIGPGVPPHALVRVANCSFLNCSVKGVLCIAPGVEVENVIFDNVTAPDSFLINTQTLLRNVIVKGTQKKGGLWVKPQDFQDAQRKEAYRKWLEGVPESTELMLDFSELEAPDTEVVGLPLSRVRWNPDRHLPLLREWGRSEAWRQLDFPFMSPLAMRMLRLENFDVAEGLYSLPLPKNKKYSQFMDQVQQMKAAGFMTPLPASQTVKHA